MCHHPPACRTADTLAETLDALEASAAILDAHAGANPVIARVAQALAAMAATAGGEDFAKLVGLHGRGGVSSARARALQLRDEALRRLWREYYPHLRITPAAKAIAARWSRYAAVFEPAAAPPPPGTAEELLYRLVRQNEEPASKRTVFNVLKEAEAGMQERPF